MANVPILDIKTLMGHKDITMTMRYAHLAPSHLSRAVELLSTFGNQQPPGLMKDETPPEREASQTA